MLLSPGGVPVSRTQEARVLETARQMIGNPDGLRGYLEPKLNGAYRLQKPPLAYWLAAASYQVFGVSPAAGRLPAILAGWFTVGLTYLAAAWLFNRRAGLIAAIVLASSYLFYRYTRLAETDTLATLFVTGAMLCWWKAKGNGSIRLYHLGALFAAGAALSKGPPAAFPLLFFLSLCFVERDWKSLKRFATSACLVTLLVIAAAWYAYLWHRGLLSVIADELDDLAAGRDHGGTFLNYFAEILVATAPWSGFLVASLVFAFREFRRDWRVRGLAVWFLAIFVPLCCIGNKQFHYLFPAAPPAALLIAILVERVLSLPREDRQARPVAWILLGTIAVAALGAVALPAGAWLALKQITPVDLILGALLLAAAAAALIGYRMSAFPGGFAALAIGAGILAPAVMAFWMPRFVSADFADFAASLKANAGPGPYVFYKQYPRLPLTFELRQPTPRVADAQSVAPGSTALIVVKHGAPAPQTPAGLQPLTTLQGREQDLYAFRPTTDVLAPGNR